jgi:hypothetical protein
MMSVPQATRGAAPPDFIEPYLAVEEVAKRLGLPLGILLRRVEAGDVPARRDEGSDGVNWSVRLSDLGVEPDTPSSNGAEPEAEPEAEAASIEMVGSAVHEADEAAADPAADAETEPARPISRRDRSRRMAEPDDAPLPLPTRSLPIPVDLAGGELRQEVQGMMLDGRELVAGLLDRWERTLEQRIFAEQRQRFELELNARQNLVKQLQLELQTARAEHAAVQAERDRRLAEKDRQLADIERQLAAAQGGGAQRRGWFWRK